MSSVGDAMVKANHPDAKMIQQRQQLINQQLKVPPDTRQLAGITMYRELGGLESLMKPRVMDIAYKHNCTHQSL